MEIKLNNLEDLLIHELKDLYSAETQILEALPKMVEAAKSQRLRDAFKLHLEQTKTQVTRLEKNAKKYEYDLRGHVCEGIKGIIKEGNEIINRKDDISENVIDAALAAAAQKVEHYEIASYGTARAYAQMLEYHDTVETLQESLDEEGDTNKALTELAMNILNKEALE